ncbi:PREDICTED: histone H1.1-like [Populus euphratica]|uniref:Histone H1.1-like n=1 Tax=Populus euphratica TaxID=75702 RepID=A0AAJ6UK22_POPEU|nr:PREDICTED: histone H1.1-like [Populus euphratica]
MPSAAVKAPSKAKANPSKSKKPPPPAASAAGAKKPRGYPTYHEMVKEALVALKERTGSSQIAIAKFIEEKQKSSLPANFKKLLLVQLKKLVANGKLVKVKNSFKLPPKSSATGTAAMKKAAATKPKPKAESKPKNAPVKRKVVAKPGPKKAAKTEAVKSPAKKAVVAVKKKTPVKKVVKKPKSIKSPAKKAVKKAAK